MIRIYAAIAALLLALAGVWYYGHTRFNAGVAHELQVVAAQTIADAAKAQTRTVAADAGAKAATDAGQVQIAANEVATHEVVRIVTRTVHDKPSPVQCVADPVSVRALQDAATRTNAAAAGVVSGTRTR